jgi:hypothetical protein
MSTGESNISKPAAIPHVPSGRLGTGSPGRTLRKGWGQPRCAGKTGMTERGESPRRERSSEPLVPESCDETVRPSRSVDRGSCGPDMGSRKDRIESADAIHDWRKAIPSEPRGARLARTLRDQRPRARREASCLGTGRSRVRLRGRFRRPRHEARRAYGADERMREVGQLRST